MADAYVGPGRPGNVQGEELMPATDQPGGLALSHAEGPGRPEGLEALAAAIGVAARIAVITGEFDIAERLGDLHERVRERRDRS